MTTALRPLQLVDGPVSPGPLTAPYGNVGSPLAARHPNRRLSLQLQSTTVPPSRFGTSTTPSSPAPSGVHLKRHSSQSQYQHHRQQRDPSAPLSPPVLTLAERHADLLRFIAQKESKCLELRQQLAQHEADLLAMKRKWERIVARGSGSSTSAGLPLSPGPGAGTSHRTSTDSTVSMDSIASGLKDGVGRVLQFSGFGDMFPAAGTVDESVPELSHAASSAVARARKHDRLSLSGSSISTASLISEADPDAERDDADGDDSHPPTPSEELLIDIDSDAFAPLKTPTSITPHRRAATLPSSSPLSPLPLHSGALAGLVNRKWEELRGTETLQKSQKRASALFTDVFNALVPPITPSASSSSSPSSSTPGTPSSTAKPLAALKPARRPASMRNASGLSLTHAPPGSVAKTKTPPPVSQQPSKTVIASASTTPTPKVDAVAFEDEWNW